MTANFFTIFDKTFDSNQKWISLILTTMGESGNQVQ